MIKRWVRAGRLYRVYRGTYAVGHERLSLEARCSAAVLARGEPEPDPPANRPPKRQGAGLSHGAGAWRLNLRKWRPAPIDVSVIGLSGRSKIPGIRTHRSGTLRPDHIQAARGIPTTIAARVILDLSPREPAKPIDRLIHEAEVQDLLNEQALRRFLDAAVGHQGLGPLLKVLHDYEATNALTDEQLEALFLELIQTHGLPKPIVHAEINGDEVDFHWPEHRLIVETDGWQFHKTRKRFEDDREKTNRLTASGQRVSRYTWRRIYSNAAQVAAELHQALAWKLVPA